MNKRFTIIALLALLSLAGCSNGIAGGITNVSLELALEGVKPALIHIDERCRVYEDAIAAVKSYVDEPSETRLADALENCEQAIGMLEVMEIPALPLTAEELEQVRDAGINIGDYTALYQGLQIYADDAVYNLYNFTYYLQMSPFSDETLANAVDFAMLQQHIFKQIDINGVNYLFAAFSGKAMDSFINDFLPALTVLYADAPGWETDRLVLERKSGFLLDELERAIEENSDRLNDITNLLLNEEKVFIDTLFDMGFTRAEVEEITADIDFNINLIKYLDELFGE